ncbi:hypothetical protein LTR56_014421 [Elasticomyces elasticus]|nr:hypothetical protein LTR22_020574 [Elasticomyces elasticus]KAK3636045.1 hypothetical protein LTR56_014421 [Elasticomyces elasticus]KAK4916688.1 hypothetical protein LTR49_015386 [Elasticomyces elasticus]KAK5754962.1 hypothetical protein LTS12_014995 [Elasticomyces elasticus]
MAQSQDTDLDEIMADDDGGVSTERHDGDHVNSDEPLQHETLPTMLLDNTYYQDASTFADGDAQLWRLPNVLPIHMCEKKLRVLVGSGAAHVYHTCCRMIRRNWSCGPIGALPSMFLYSTPYSLLFMVLLRMLSSYSKKNRTHAHDVLIRQWKDRVISLGLTAPVTSRSFQTTGPPTSIKSNAYNMRYCEESIEENSYGVTIIDLCEALGTLKQQDKVVRLPAAVSADTAMAGDRNEHDSREGAKKRRAARKQREWEKFEKASLESEPSRRSQRLAAKRAENPDEVHTDLDDLTLEKLRDRPPHVTLQQGVLFKETKPKADSSNSQQRKPRNPKRHSGLERLQVGGPPSQIDLRAVHGNSVITASQTLNYGLAEPRGTTGSDAESELMGAMRALDLERMGQRSLPG